MVPVVPGWTPGKPGGSPWTRDSSLTIISITWPLLGPAGRRGRECRPFLVCSQLDRVRPQCGPRAMSIVMWVAFCELAKRNIFHAWRTYLDSP